MGITQQYETLYAALKFVKRFQRPLYP